MGQGGVLGNAEMRKLLGSEVGVVDVPTKLLLVFFAIQLEVEMDRN